MIYEEPPFALYEGLVERGAVMRLIEAALEQWDDDDPPRHALSVLWGQVRDLKAIEPEAIL